MTYEAEEALLGSIIWDNEKIYEVQALVRDTDFADAAHRRIFESMVRLSRGGQKIDAVTLESGTNPTVLDCAAAVPAGNNAIYYAHKVLDTSTRNKLHSAGVRIQSLSQEKELETDEIIHRAESLIMGLDDRNDGAVAQLHELAPKQFSEFEKRSEGKAGHGRPSGLRGLDNLLAGLSPTDLVVLAARPSMGKTAFALQQCLSVAKEGLPVYMVELEMSKEQLVTRAYALESGISLHKLNTGDLKSEDFDRLHDVGQTLASLPLYVDDRGNNNMASIAAQSRRLQHIHGELGLVAVDYIQLMYGDRNLSREQQVSEISRSLKHLAKDLRIPVLALSQLNRSCELRVDKRPMLSDLRESGAIEQDADEVMFLYRDWVYDKQADETAAEVIVRKNRDGPIGTVECQFTPELARFKECVL